MQRLARAGAYDVATVQWPTEDASSPIGDPADSVTWSTVPGLEAVPASLANVPSRRGQEVRTAQSTYTSNDLFLLLYGYYPQITTRHRVTLAQPTQTLTLDVIGVDADSSKTLTRLTVQIITP